MSATLSGALEGRASWLRRILARASARDLQAFVAPGPEVARAYRLDLEAAGLQLADTPRHASVLVLVGEMPAGLKRAAAVAYAQMPRPRAILGVGAGDVSPLPEPDASADMEQEALEEAVAGLRRSFAEGAFSAEAPGFDVDEIRTQTQYVCPMHPEVVSDEPGTCPKCGMDLVPRESAGGMDHGHMDHSTHEGMDHGTMDHSGHGGHDNVGHEAMDHDGPGGHGQTGHEAHGSAGMQHGSHEEHNSRGGADHGEMDHGESSGGHEHHEDAEHGGHGEHQGHSGHMDHGDMDHDHMGHDHGAHGEDEARPDGGPGEHEVMDHGGHDRMDHGEMDHGHAGDGHTEHEAMDHGGHGSVEPGAHESHTEAEHERRGETDHGGMEHGGAPDDHAHHGEREHGDDQDHSAHGDMDHGQMSHGGMDHGGHEGHGHIDHGDMGFMSMVEMTKDLPRSPDGLPMEWIEVPFGPLFPGLPGGLSLTLSLDGDTVAEVEATTGLEGWAPPENLAGPANTFARRLSRLDPLAPISYRLLALRFLEDATGVVPNEPTVLARVGALERERAASHLGWIASFGYLLGYRWLEMRAAKLQLALLGAEDAEGVSRVRSEAGRLSRRVDRTPLLRRRLGGIGRLPDGAGVSGPVARARGVVADARQEEEAYRSLGFEPLVLDGDDALARLRVRLAEVDRSLDLVARAGSVSIPEVALDGTASGTGAVALETPRGTARLRATLEEGALTGVELDTPSTHHLGLVEYVAEQRELADALVGTASLDISPWEVVR